MGRERRRHIRVRPEVNRPIRIEINGENFIEAIVAADISVGGIAILVASGFEDCRINRPVSLVVSIPEPEKREFVVNGQIRNIVDKRFGVQFIDLKSEHLECIKRYVRYRLKEIPWHTRVKLALGYY